MEERHYTSRIILVLLILAIIVIVIFLIKSINNVEEIKLPKYIEITAHRGFSEYYPENTMEAFVKAHEAGADWIELDIQETKDLVVVVTHYANLKKLTKVNKNIWTLNYKDVKKLNAGAYMDKEASIPTLEEVIIWAKNNNAKLNIELKDNGHQKQLVKSTIDLINKYGYKNNVLVASQNYDFLKNVKDYDPTMTTVYVGRALEQPVNYYVYADIFSIRKTDLTKELVTEMHNVNKKVYAWTILNEEEALQMVDYDVDNLIANDVKLIKDVLDKRVSE